LNAHGINIASHSNTGLSLSDRFLALSRVVLPEAGRVLSDGLLISILGLIFLIVMVENPDAKKSVRSERLHSHSDDVRRYIAISAKTGAITRAGKLGTLAGSWCGLPAYLVCPVLLPTLHPQPGFHYLPVASDLCGAAHIRLAACSAGGRRPDPDKPGSRLCPKPDFHEERG